MDRDLLIVYEHREIISLSGFRLVKKIRGELDKYILGLFYTVANLDNITVVGGLENELQNRIYQL